MMMRAALLAAFLASVPVTQISVAEAASNESTYVAPLSYPVLEARALALQKELRCLVCQGQSIDESNAALATDLRRLLREQIQQGLTDDQIKEFMVARYGVFVLMNPPVRGDTFLLWFGPLLLLLGGGAAVGVIILRSRRRLATEPAVGDLESEA